jgi:AsmA-like protein/uncharacterized protein DUF3971
LRAATGQALRWLRRIALAAVALSLVGGIALGALAWRLAQGPLALPPLARQIEREANARLAAAGDGGMRIEVGTAAIAWEGWSGGAAAPLDIRVTGVRLRDAEGGLRAELPDASVTLSVRALLRGRLAPATVELHRPTLLLTREADGSIGLEAAGPAAAADPAAAEESPLDELLADLMRPAAEEGAGAHASLRRLRITDATVVVLDRALDRRWSLVGTGLDIRRAAAGGLAAEGGGTLRSGDLAVPVRLSGTASGAPMRVTASLALPAVRPAALGAALFPDLAALQVLDAPVSLAATVALDAEGRPERLQARLEAAAGGGAIDLGDGRRIPFLGLEAALAGEGGAMRLTGARLRLPGAGPGGAGGPALTARGEANRAGDGAWAATLDIGLADPFAVPDLARLWPEGLAPEARRTALAALPAGLLREARLGLALRLPEGPGAPRLGEARASALVEAAMIDLAALGAARPGRGAPARVAAERIELAATATPEALRLERLALRLPPPPGAVRAGPSLTAEGEALRDRAPGGGGWRGALTLALDPVRFADLPRYWPEGLRPGEREWITRNITAGTFGGGRWRLEAEMPEGRPEALRATALSGTAEAADATVHWLRPIPPLLGVAATASFSLSEIAIRTRGGRQAAAEAGGGGGGGRGGIEAREGLVRFFDLDREPGQAEVAVPLAGPLPEVFALLRHPRLKLFERRKLEIGAAAGAVEARLQVGFPLLAALPMEEVRIRATGRVAEARLTEVLLGHELDRGNFEVSVDTDGLRLNGSGAMVEAPLRVALEMDFRGGGAAQVTERATVTVPRADARQLAAFGLDAPAVVEGGTAAVEARYERRRGGAGQVALRADLREARLALDPLNWAKPPGAPGQAEAVLRLQGEALTAVEGLRIEASPPGGGAGLSLRGRVAFLPGSRLDLLEIAEGSALGASRFGGEVRRPEREGGPWQVALRGPLLDLRPILSPQPPTAAAGGRRRAELPQGGAPGPALALDLRFERMTTGEGRNLLGVVAQAQTDGRGVLRQAQATGRTAAAAGGPQRAGAFEFALTPQGQERHLRLTAEDGGALLRALDLVDSIQGGRLLVTAAYPELRPGAPLAGTAELDGFAVRNAPALGKLLQAMTLYGVVEALQGGDGLAFARLVAPFALTREALGLDDARAFSASLGVTAKGRILRERGVVDIEGTVVPAYFFNQLLGNIPILGRLFSPERGGGVFAATYRVQGPLPDPNVTVNPLAALTPGFLRGLFGLADGGARGGTAAER